MGGREGAMKIAAEKIKPTTFLIFLVLFSSPIKGPAMIAMRRYDGEGGVLGWLGDKNRHQKN